MPSDADYFGSRRRTVITGASGLRIIDLHELWAYRELLWVLTERDLRVRYRQTLLGAAWALIQPVTLMIIFTVFFGHLAKMPSDGYPYTIFVYTALLPWTFFSNALASAAGSVVASPHLISKVYFPRLLIPLASIGSWLADFLIASLILLLLMLYYDIGWSVQLLAAPLLLLAIMFTALGVGTLLCALNVMYRDFRYVIPFLLQFWMFATPIIYPVSLIPERWQWVVNLNPMAGLVEGFRSAFLGGPFDLPAIALSFVVAMVIFVAGIAYFERVERRFADLI